MFPPSRSLLALSVACLLVGSGVASAALFVDFNSTTQDGGPHNQSGYEPYDAGHEVAADFVTRTYSAFGTTVSFTPQWPDTFDNRVQQMIDRGAGNDANYDGNKLNLMTDWIGIDTRTGNGGNGDGPPTTMTFTLAGLPAGPYDYRSYHHDTEYCNSVFDISLTDANGASTVGTFEMTASSPGGSVNDNQANPGPGNDPDVLSSTVNFGLASDGTNPVVITYTTYGASAGETGVHNQIFGVNGFELLAAGEPPPPPPPAPSEFKIDVDVGALVTEPGWTSLPVSGSSGSVTTGDVTFTVFSADSSRDRGAPNALTRDFIFDDGDGQASGLTVFGLPAGTWKAEVWAWDQSAAAGDQIVGITQFAAGPELIYTDSFSASPTDPFTFTFNSGTLPNGFGIFTRENNAALRSRFNALRLTAAPPPLDMRIDIDSTTGAPIATEPGWTSLDATAGNGSMVVVDGVMYTVFSADGTRNRGGTNDLTTDFLFDDGGGQACGLTIRGLPDGLWEASVWAWDNSFPTTVGDLIVGITQFGAGPEIIFTDAFAANPTDPFTFRFDSTNLPDGFGIFTRENNQWNRARFNALQLKFVPEPTTLGLLGLGLLALARRRRRR